MGMFSEFVRELFICACDTHLLMMDYGESRDIEAICRKMIEGIS